MTRVMIHMHNSPMQFWAKEINMACYTTNRIFLRPRTNRTSYELWIGRKPNLKYFRTFDSECYMLKDRENFGKFDVKSDLGIFLGYSIMSKVYSVYNQNSKIIQESSNVVVNDIGYDHDIIESQILTHKSIEDNPKDLEITKENSNDIPKRNIDPDMDENVPLDDALEEIKNKHRSKIPKNHPISCWD